MNFIDKLEQFLLRPRAKVYYNRSLYGNSNEVIFSLGSDRRNYGQQDKEKKKDGIISMMKKLRDNNYQHEEYTNFFLDLIGWDYFNDILALEPSNEDLFNLYKIAGYIKDNKLKTFLKIVEDKEWKLTFFKYGHDYRIDWHSKNQLRGFIGYLPTLNDDEWIDALTHYFKNSIGWRERESKEELIEICIECIKDNYKCEKFIKFYFDEDINLSTLFVENKVNQLKVDSKNIIKNFGYRDNAQVDLALRALHELLSKNCKKIGSITQVDFYNIDTEFNFITYNDHDGMGIETIKWLINEMMPTFKASNLTQKIFKDDYDIFNDDFLKRVLFFNMSHTIEEKNIKQKIIKI